MQTPSLIRQLPKTLLARMKEARNFVIVGIGNLFFSYTIYLMMNLVTTYTLAFGVSFFSGVLFSAYCNSRYSFSARLTAARLAVFTVVCLVNYFIGLQFLKWFVEGLGIHEAAAPILVIAVMVPISFLGTRLALVGSLTGASKLSLGSAAANMGECKSDCGKGRNNGSP
jgi:putative flippase GtrA